MVSVVVVAGGKGKRMGRDINKQYIKIAGVEVIARTLDIFNKHEKVDEIILVVPEEEIDFSRENIINKYGFNKIRKVVKGGKERQNSVYNGLIACNKNANIVLIHDGARPFINKEIIDNSIYGALEYGACTTAVPVKDTIKRVDNDGFSLETPDRRELYSVQTPQAFKYDVILSCHEKIQRENIIVTDDTFVVEKYGIRVKIIEGSYYNIKITTPEDLIFAEAILCSLAREED